MKRRPKRITTAPLPDRSSSADRVKSGHPDQFGQCGGGRRPRRGVLLTILGVLIALTPVSTSVLAQQAEDRRPGKTALDEVADGITALLREAIGNGRRRPGRAAVAMDAPAEAVMQEVPLAEDERRARRSRVETHTAAMLQWLTKICELDDQQQQNVQKFIDRRANQLLDKWSQPAARNNNNNHLSPAFPVKFTLRYGGAESVDVSRHRADLQPVLSDDQFQKLQQAAQERRDFHLDAVTDRVLNLMDEQLFLSGDQRRQMRAPLKKRLQGMESTSFSLQGQSYYYPQQSIAFLLQRGTHLQALSERQMRRAKELAEISKSQNFNSEQYIMFESASGPEQWQKQLEEQADRQRDRIRQSCAVRAEFFGTEWQLSERSIRMMDIAAKGVADRIVASWKKSTRATLKSYEEQAGAFGGNFSFSMRVADLNQIDRDPLWTHTVKRIRPDPVPSTYDRVETIRQANANYLTGLIDRELWLLPEQRSEVQSRILKSLPENDHTVQQHSYMGDVAWMVIPLFKFSQRDAEVFRDAQKRAWDRLKEEFDFNGRHAVVNLQNGRGVFHFQVPQ